MIFLLVDVSIHYKLILQSFPKALWWGIIFTLTIVCVVHCRSIWPYGTHVFWVTRNNVLPHMVTEPVFFFFSFSHLHFFLTNVLCIQNTTYKYGATYTIWTVSPYDCSDTNTLSWLRVTWLLICRPERITKRGYLLPV